MLKILFFIRKKNVTNVKIQINYIYHVIINKCSMYKNDTSLYCIGQIKVIYTYTLAIMMLNATKKP